MRNLTKSSFSISRISLGIFLAFLLVRVGFALFSGYDSFQLQADSARYDALSDGILRGDFNLLTFLYITAPFYPYFEAFMKLLFGPCWIPALQLVQITLSSLSGVYLYKTARLLWGKMDIALIAAAVYCFFPFTLWWVHTFSQETLFQCFLIFAMYFLVRAVNLGVLSSLIASAVLFSLAFLTKSHILLFAPFIPAVIFLSQKFNFWKKVVYSAVFAAVCLVFTLPYGLYNLKVNGLYVFSSSSGGHFLLGHNDDVYLTIVAPPPRGSGEYDRLSRGDFLVFHQLSVESLGLSQTQLDRLYYRTGINWCLENPQKAAALALYDLYYFLMPGLNRNWYSFVQWLASIVVSTPLYLLGYLGIIMALKRDFKRHFWMLGLFLSMIVFSVGFYVQNRFRTITLEPFYILYAALPASYILNRFSRRYAEWAAKFNAVSLGK